MIDRPLVQRNKALARTLLYLLPLLLAGTILAFVEIADRLGFDLDWETGFEDEPSVLLLQQYLQINTSYLDGDELAGARFLVDELEKTGVTVNLEQIGDRNAVVWAILEGRDPGLLVLHSHIDTEPVLRPEAWRHPPFAGIIEGPFIFGRGAFDMKSVTIAQLMAFQAVAASGEKPEVSLMFLATGDEERGSWLGTRWWLEQHPELAERMDAVLTEGGAVEAVELDDVKYWGTEFGQKYFVDIWVCDSSRERLEMLRDQLVAQGQGVLRPPSPEVAQYLRAYGPSRSRGELRHLLATPETMLDMPEAVVLTRRIKALIQNSLVAFPIEEDSAGGYQMRLILHLLPGVTLEEGLEELIPDRLHGFTHSFEIQHPPIPFSPLDHWVYQGIDRGMATLRPDATHGPLVIPWSASDARYFRARGIPAYGFSPFVILSGDSIRMRSANERLAVPPFVEGVELYVELIRQLVAEPRPAVPAEPSLAPGG